MSIIQAYVVETDSSMQALDAESTILSGPNPYFWHRFTGEGSSRVHIQFATADEREGFISRNDYNNAREEVLRLSKGARLNLLEFSSRRKAMPFGEITFG